MLIIRGGINSKKRELCPTALALSAFYYNKNKHADTYIMYLHAYSTRGTRESAHCLRFAGHIRGLSKRGKDTESDARRDAEEMLRFCSKEPPPASSTRNILPFCFYLSLLFSAVSPGYTGFLGIYDSTTASPQGASVRTAPAATGVSVKRSVPAFPVWVTVRGSSE